MNNILVYTTASVCGLALILSGCVTCCTLRNIDRIGDDQNLKRELSFRCQFNFYALALISFVTMFHAFGFIGSELFIALIIILFGGLGFKISAELFR